ncbi:MAG: hypothetical protein ACM3PE_00915 [Deltaproteobacteria bacterium]
MIKKLVMIFLGILLIVLAARYLSLLYAGDTTQAIIDEARLVKVKSQTQGGRHYTGKFTGLYYLKTKVAYHFDIYPTPSEALLMASDAPLQTGIKGRDLLSDLSSFPDTKYARGDQIKVLYLKYLPRLNAAYQPQNLKFYGFSELIIGALLLAWGILSRKRLAGSAVDEESDLLEKRTWNRHNKKIQLLSLTGRDNNL